MKTLKLCIALLIITISANAQSPDKYTAAMQKGMTLIDSASTSEQFTTAANFFERIAAAETKQWLPQYYAGFCNLHVAILGKQASDTKDDLYDKAMSYAEKADALKPVNSEVLVLEGYITFMKMSVFSQQRAMTMIPKANALLEKALAIDPENPRAYLVKGQDTFYTPEAFGGGKAKAKDILTTAADKYKNQKASGFEPAWGAHRCQALLQQCN
jgi:tetratricopeptide (TPR) repeat protein